MSIHKDKKRNTYYVKYKNGKGISQTKRGFKSKLDAKKYEIAIKEDYSENVSLAFNKLSEEYLDEIKRNVTRGTYLKYKDFIENKIIPNIENKEIDKYSANDCRVFRNCIQGMDYSTKYKNEMITVFKSIFKFASVYHGLIRNPTLVIKKLPNTPEENMKRKKKEEEI